MLKNAKRKLAALLAATLILSGMPAGAAAAAEDTGSPAANETTETTDNLETDENDDENTSVPPVVNETVEDADTPEKPVPTAEKEPDGDTPVEDEEEKPVPTAEKNLAEDETAEDETNVPEAPVPTATIAPDGDELAGDETDVPETPVPTATKEPVQDGNAAETPVPTATKAPVEDGDDALENETEASGTPVPTATIVPDMGDTITPAEPEEEEEMSAEEIAEAVYAQLAEDSFKTLATKLESVYAGMEGDESAQQDAEKILSLIEGEVAGYLAGVLEEARAEYACLEKEDIFKEVYDSLYEKVLNTMKELLDLRMENSDHFSLLPLEEKAITPDLRGLTPVELTMVPFSKIFEGEDMTGVEKISYAYNDSEDDYIISSYSGKANLSRNTSSSYRTWFMIPGGDQLDNNAIRYLVRPQQTTSSEWLIPTVYIQDAGGSRTEAAVFSYKYNDYDPSNNEVWIRIADEVSSEKMYLKFDINESLYGESANRAAVKFYEGRHKTAEEAQAGADITDKIFGNIDMKQSDAGYSISRYNTHGITIVTFDTNGNVTGCLPLNFYVSAKDSSPVHNYISMGSMFKRIGSKREYVNYSLRSEGTGENSKTTTYELYDGYPVNDTYSFTMTYYENGNSNNNAVTAAYKGTYASIMEAESNGAEDVREALFGRDYDTEGYNADYSNGIDFTIFIGADGEGQEIYHYCIKTKAGIQPKSNSVGVTFNGLKDKDKNNVPCYIVRSKDDSYGDGSYPTIVVAGDVDLTRLAPVFRTDSGVSLYAAGGNAPEVSGESYHDFSQGAVAYTTGSESKKNQRNVWLSVVKEDSLAGMIYNLYTNSLSDKDANTHIENGVIYSKREVILSDKNDGHDIFLINMGTNVIPKLSVELVSDVMQIDEYWTLNGNHDLAEFSGTTTTENYGELANMAKVRLKVKDGITSGEEVKGTLTVKANGTAIMVLELTGIAGAPVIVTDSIPEAVKYVPYGTMIQNSNKYSKTKVKYILDSGTLPEGMQFMENGELYGVPKEVGTFEFWVRMASTNPDSSMTKKFTLVVKENTDANVDAATDAGYEVTQRIPSVALNSSGSYTFVSQGVLNEFIDVYLDGEKLARDVDYNAESGSTRLTISSQTLTRSNTTGTHTLGVEFRTTNENMLKAAAQNFNVLTEGSSTGDPDSSGDSGSSGGSSSSGDSGSDSNSNDNPGSTESAANTSDNAPAGAIVTGNGGNSAGTASGAAAGTAAGSEPIIYTIVSGDTLSKIALKHYGNASLWTKIYEDNRDIISNPDVIRVGWQIKIYPMAAGDTANAALTNANQTDTEQGNTGTTVDGTYVVQSGDTLWKISKKIYGWGWQWRKIYDANRDTIQAPGVLHMGQVIIIP